MHGIFEHATALQYRVKALERRVAGFESGQRYVRMQEAHRAALAAKDREIAVLKRGLAESRAQSRAMAKKWLQTYDDVEAGHAREMAAKDREIRKLCERLEHEAGRADRAEARLREKRLELYEAQTRLEEAEGKCAKLAAQMRRDHENSSLPSSAKPNRKPIPNGREKTGRRPGGQPGHEGHGRKRLEPTETVFIETPDEYKDASKYRPTGRTVSKQVVDIALTVNVRQYEAEEFRDLGTGQRVHAPFPPGVVNEVCYGGGVKALAFLLNTDCCVSIDKTRRLLSELTGGALDMSKGMVAGLCQAFSSATEAQRRAAFADLLLRPVMNTDFTVARVNGKNAHVCVCAAPGLALYFARESKGKKGVAGTPAEDYQGILVHDHDVTFYGYGGAHQECLAHILRYLLDSVQNEPGLDWNKRMRALLREMIHCRNALPDGEAPSEADARAFLERYDAVLELARKEYEYEPPGKYYRDGYNLYLRLRDYKESTLLFLRDPAVPPDNNLSERLLRVFKRKQKQAMAMRSFASLECLCDSLGTIVTMRMRGEDLFAAVSGIFSV